MRTAFQFSRPFIIFLVAKESLKGNRVGLLRIGLDRVIHKSQAKFPHAIYYRELHFNYPNFNLIVTNKLPQKCTVVNINVNGT